MPRKPAPREDVLSAALLTFRELGYAETTLEQVARRAGLDADVVQAQFADKDQLFAALLRANSPLEALETALDGVEGETADEMLRDAMRRMVRVTHERADFFELAIIDAQVNNGAFLASLSAGIFPKARQLLNRMKATGQLRPVADVIFGRTLVALLIGFAISERAMPNIARQAMRLMPQRAWLDGMIDLLLYGVLEDDAR